MVSFFILHGIKDVGGKRMISVKGRKLHIDINFSIPLPSKYRGGGVAVFRINNGQPEVLLGLRANNPGRGLWSFPGGGAEGSEKLSSAAFREFKEETGIQLHGRYISRTGLFKIKSYFFEWNTVLIESTQEIEPRIKNEKVRYYGGEFLSMRWVPLSELGNIKLHRWVKEAVNFYTSGKMTPYTASPPKNIKLLPKPVKKTRTKAVHRATGGDMLFDMAEMVLTKVDRDGTKYYKPVYQASNKPMFQEALYGV